MLLPGPSNLESYSLCQQDPGAGTECLMLPALSVNSRRVWHWFPLDSLLPKAPFSAVTWVFGKKLLTCCQSDREPPELPIPPWTIPPALGRRRWPRRA